MKNEEGGNHDEKEKGQRPEAPAPKTSTETIAPDMETLLTKFADVFPAELPKGLPPPRPTYHRIILKPSTLPPLHCLHRVPLTQNAELKRQIDELLAAGHIERAQSPFCAGVLFV